MFALDVVDIIYFLAGFFMVFILFAGVDQNFAIIIGFLIVAAWFQLKKITD